MLNRLLISVFLLFLPFHLTFAAHPFSYDLHLSYTYGKSSDVMILAHGMGGNYQIKDVINVDKTLISFNFPDYDYSQRALKTEQTTFGTINELLPLLYVIKKSVVEEGQQTVDLYGFSAGGGAIINALAALNTNRFDENLKAIGISQKEKDQMLQAIQKGVIILDSPLKSIEEIIAFRGSNHQFEVFAKRYQANDMEPINALKYLNGLSLHVILYFQNPDEALSNRDDNLYYSRLKTYNARGTTKLIVSNDGGHLAPHYALWNYYWTAQKS